MQSALCLVSTFSVKMLKTGSLQRKHPVEGLQIRLLSLLIIKLLRASVRQHQKAEVRVLLTNQKAKRTLTDSHTSEANIKSKVLVATHHKGTVRSLHTAPDHLLLLVLNQKQSACVKKMSSEVAF